MAGARPSAAAAIASGLWRHVPATGRPRKRGRCFGGSTARTPGSMDSIGLWTRHIVREVYRTQAVVRLRSSLK